MKIVKDAIAAVSASQVLKPIEEAEQQWSEHVEAFKTAVEKAGRFLGNMCVVQAMFRELSPGETRQQLVQKARKGFEKKYYLKAEPNVMLLLGS